MSVWIPKEQIRQSWDRCLHDHIPNNLVVPSMIPKKMLASKDEEYRLLIDSFCTNVNKIIKLIEGRYIFKLFDETGVLLTGRASQGMPETISKDCIMPGRIFSETSVGTNVISLSMELQKAVYLPPECHYNLSLQQWHAYAYPLKDEGKIIGFLALCTYKEPLSVERIVIVNLLAEQVICQYKDAQTRSEISRTIQLTQQQKKVLEFLCQGLTEEAIALEMNLSVNTVKYHKRKIFSLLDCRSTTETVFKAVKLNLIS